MRLLSTTCLLLACIAVPACKRADAPTPPPPEQQAPAPSAAAQAGPVELKDTMETGEGYIIGISYPGSARRYPGLAAEIKAYADAARAQLMQAIPEAGATRDGGAVPYDLSLGFVELHASPQLVVVAADGSIYTGGAHGEPLVRRFVWLPGEQRMLTVQELLDGTDGLAAVARHAREQLHGAMSMRLDAEDLPPAERAEQARTAGAMIDEGTEPTPANFDEFEPVLDTSGRIAALRFVFPPYQVGPYAAGIQTVEIPAALLLPHVSQRYRALFAGS